MSRREHLAVLAAVVALQAFGWLWYSPLLFVSPWLHGLGKEIGRVPMNTPVQLGVACAGNILIAYTLAWAGRILRVRTFRQGLGMGALLGLGLAVPAVAAREALLGLAWNVAWVDALGTLVASALAAGIIAAIGRPDDDRPDQD